MMYHLLLLIFIGVGGVYYASPSYELRPLVLWTDSNLGTHLDGILLEETRRCAERYEHHALLRSREASPFYRIFERFADATAPIAPTFTPACWMWPRLGYPYPEVSLPLNWLDRGIALADYLWNNAAVLIYVYVLLISLSVCFLMSLIWYFSRGTAIEMDAPRIPFAVGACKASFEDFVRATPIVVTPSDGHPTLAFVRASLEKWAQDFLYRHFNKIRDIGGSLKRNAFRGSRLHVCFPDMDPADHDKLARNDYRNDFCLRKGHQCKSGIAAAVMSYVDFHMSIDELAGSIKGPTIVITHPFHKLSSFDWFDGEAVGKCAYGQVAMTTRKGASYTHAYHQWEDEGVIVGKSSVARYFRLGSYGHSDAYLAYPANGPHHKHMPGAMRAVPKPASYNLATGVVARREGDNFAFYLDSDFFVKVGQVMAATIIRSAYSLSGVSRTGNYLGNLNGTIRTRLSADKQDMNMCDHVAALVSRLADDYALTLNHCVTFLPEQVIGISCIHRFWLKTFSAVYNNSPTLVRHATASIWRKIIGSSKRTSWARWMWQDVVVPAYTIHTAQPGNVGSVRTANPAKQPFLPAGQAPNAQPAPVNSGATGINVGQPNRQRGNKSSQLSSGRAPSPSLSTTPTGSKGVASRANANRAQPPSVPASAPPAKTTGKNNLPARKNATPRPSVSPSAADRIVTHCGKCLAGTHGFSDHPEINPSDYRKLGGVINKLRRVQPNTARKPAAPPQPSPKSATPPAAEPSDATIPEVASLEQSPGQALAAAVSAMGETLPEEPTTTIIDVADEPGYKVPYEDEF